MPIARTKWSKVKENLQYNEIHNLIAAAKDGQEGADQFMLQFLREDKKVVHICNLVDLIGIEEEFLRSMRKVNIYRLIPVTKN